MHHWTRLLWNYLNIMHILYITCMACIFGSTFLEAQDIFAYDNCDLISCPLDCYLSFSEGEDCPICTCPPGQRCPNLTCPPEPMCLKVQRLDGCLNCACAGATYHAFDETKNMATFVMNPRDSLIIPQETCNLYDIQSVQRCMKDFFTYVKSIERTNPDVIAHPMVSMFLYSRSELLELCNLYSQSLRCVSTDTRQRCSDQERHMQMMISMFDSICVVRQKPGEALEGFLNNYDCIHNILVSHVSVDQCSTKMNRKFGKTSKDESVKTQIKRQRKCDALNEFMDCVEPTLKTFCGRRAVDAFRAGLLNATNAIAPECRTSGNSFVPLQFQERSGHEVNSTKIERRFVIR